jgi:hypothetical protein
MFCEALAFLEYPMYSIPSANSRDVIITYMYKWELHASNALQWNQDELKQTFSSSEKQTALSKATIKCLL